MNTAWAATQPASATGQALASGARVAEYQVIELLREGSAHALYRAHDRVRDEVVLLKEYLPAHIATRNGRGLVGTALRDAGEFARGRGEFLQRGLLTARFAHPALMPVQRVLEHGGTGYWVRPWLPGEPLAQASAARRPGPDHAWTLTLLRPLLELLARLHAAGVTGVDLSAANVHVTQGARAQLLAVRAAAPALGLSTGAGAAAERDLRALALLVRRQLAHPGASHRFPQPFLDGLDALSADRPHEALRSAAAFAEALGIETGVAAERRARSVRAQVLRAPARPGQGLHAFAPTQPFEHHAQGYAATLPQTLPDPNATLASPPAPLGRPSPEIVILPPTAPPQQPVITTMQPSRATPLPARRPHVHARGAATWRPTATWWLAAAGVALLALGLRR